MEIILCADFFSLQVFASQLISDFLYPIVISRVAQVGWRLGFSLRKSRASLGSQA